MVSLFLPLIIVHTKKNQYTYLSWYLYDSPWKPLHELGKLSSKNNTGYIYKHSALNRIHALVVAVVKGEVPLSTLMKYFSWTSTHKIILSPALSCSAAVAAEEIFAAQIQDYGIWCLLRTRTDVELFLQIKK